MTAQSGLQPRQEWGEGAKSATADKALPTLEHPGSLAGPERKSLSRRELLTYVWFGTLAALTVGGGAAGYQFLYPRRPANTFGGIFYLGAASNLPPAGSDPQANVSGRFWLSNTENGVHAFYNLCTHSWGGGTKYYWVPQKSRFECPVCGSKFNLAGHYIEGPAPRSLDQFVIEIVTGRRVLSKTMLTQEAIVSPSIPSPDAEIVVDTGKTIEGLSRFASPLLRGYRG